MSQKIKIIIQKRTSLKSQIVNLFNLLEKGNLDNVTLKLRSTRITELYHAFEEKNDELMILDANNTHSIEFEDIQEKYYTLTSKVETILNSSLASTSGFSSSANSEENQNNSAISKNGKKRIKLPVAPLPTFDGKYENWLSFKNAFKNIIDSQSDLSDIDKLHYLETGLTGDAVNKLNILTVDGTNYSKAWELLGRAYEVKRILISKHISSLLNLPVLDKETTNDLSKLADDAQQHLASLKTLGVSVGPEVIVNVLESKLPRSVFNRWENKLERDEFPTPDQTYEFLYKSAVCASKRERAKITENV